MDKTRRLYSNAEITEFKNSDDKIFGEPASNSYTVKNRNVNNQKGNFGEQIIGNMLNLLACETPDFYVFHSVGLPMETDGETDHVVVYKNRIILIETKTFSGYSSLQVNEKGVLRGVKPSMQRPLKVEDNHLLDKIQIFQRRFDNREVHGLLVLVRDEIQTSSSHPKYQVASLDNFSKMMRQQMGAASEVKEVAWPAVKFFSMHCISKTVKNP